MADDSSSDESVDPRELAALRDMKQKQKKGPRSARPAGVNNVVGLRQKLKEIELPKEWAWVEKCSFTSGEPVEVDDVHDDLSREAAFYKASLSAVKGAVEHLDQSGIPYRRPRDYYAEMIKTDAHMARVKGVLLGERRRMDAAADRKKQRELKKYAKKTQAASLAEKSRAKREMNEAVTKWRKGAKHNEVRLGAADLEDAIMGRKEKRSRDQSSSGRGGGASGKRRRKDEKYGNSFKGKRSKSNDKKSVDDMSDFRGGRNRSESFGGGGRGGRGGSGKSGGARPGKSKRQQMRGR